MGTEKTTPATGETTTVYYRTIYMRPTATPRTKTFESESRARIWLHNHADLQVIRIDKN